MRSGKIEPVQFERVFKKGVLKRQNLTIFEAIFSCKSHMPERRKVACKMPIFTFKGPLFLNPF